MFAQALARRLSRAGVHYGWAIVAIIFFLALATAGCMGVSGAQIVIAAGAVWLIGGAQTARERLIEARA